MPTYELVRLARKPSVAARLSARLPRRRHRLPPGPESAELPQRGQGDEFVHDGSVLLPTLGDEVAPDSRRALLTDLYTEVCASWRMLVDVRFKLLGLVPAVSALALIQLFEKSDGAEKVGDAVQLVVCMLAFAVTVGLFVYDRRNSGLHDDLISRGRRIERELGMENGQFLGRRGARHALLTHDSALMLIYSAVALAWLGAAGIALVGD